jgi:hypothetical protein
MRKCTACTAAQPHTPMRGLYAVPYKQVGSMRVRWVADCVGWGTQTDEILKANPGWEKEIQKEFAEHKWL